MSDLEELAKEKSLEAFKKAIGGESDTTMLILRAHLFSENLLEQLINIKLPRGDKIIENGNFTYNQKLQLIDALDVLPDSVVSSLRNLNKLRNQCAHELDKKISEGDINRIGSPLGKEFTRIKKEAKFNEAIILRKVVTYICGFLSAGCYMIEHPELLNVDASKKNFVKSEKDTTDSE